MMLIEPLLSFILSIPIVMKYKILPTEATPYWLFGILFLMLILYIVVSLRIVNIKNKHTVENIKNACVIVIILISVTGVSITTMIDRYKTAPEYNAHDIILQQEAAMRYLIEGKNPYKETYFGTPVEKFHYDEMGKAAVNPALYHFVMPPWYLLFPFVFYYPSVHFLHFFDGRMASLFSLIGLITILFVWFKNSSIRRIAMLLMALAPGIVDYFLEGRSDMFALFWFVLSLFLLDRKKPLFSAIVFGLALMSKQTIWFSFPFYIIALWISQAKMKIKTTRYLFVSLSVCLLLCLPFLMWDARAFVNSTVLYLSGNTANSYPISGYGLGMMLYNFGIIKDIHSYYPFVIWQAIIALPFMIVLVSWYIRKPSYSRLLIGYALSLFAVWYLSRYFNNSHLGYIGQILIIGLLKDTDESEKSIT